MARKRGKLDFKNETAGIGKRHRAEKTGWKKERLLAIKLLLEGELDIAAVARLVGRHRNSINDWIKLFRNGGIEALLKRGEGSGRKGKMTAEAKAELWVYDEMRYGLHPLVRRVWSLKGVRVVTPVERRFEWGWSGWLRIEAGGGELAQGELVADLVVQAALVAFDAEDVVAAYHGETETGEVPGDAMGERGGVDTLAVLFGKCAGVAEKLLGVLLEGAYPELFGALEVLIEVGTVKSRSGSDYGSACQSPCPAR